MQHAARLAGEDTRAVEDDRSVFSGCFAKRRPRAGGYIYTGPCVLKPNTLFAKPKKHLSDPSTILRSRPTDEIPTAHDPRVIFLVRMKEHA